MNRSHVCRRSVTGWLRFVGIFAMLLCLNVLPCSYAGSGIVPGAMAGSEDAELAGRLDAVLNEAIAQQKIVGAVVMAARNGHVVYKRAVGLADRESGKTMSLDTRFRLASMSKPLVTVAALALAEQGNIGLDDPVTRWIPSFTPMYQGKVAQSITVRHLLTHTAGLSYGFLEPKDSPMALAGVSDGLDDPSITLDENIWRLASVPLYYEPGTNWRYSLAIDVLGEIVSRAGGDTLPEVVKKYVTGPLGMKATGFVADRPELLAAAYVWADGKPRRMAKTEIVPNGVSVTRYEPGRALDAKAFASGGAGMVGTAEDYLKFLEALRTGGAPVLKPQTVTAMTSDQISPIFLQTVGAAAAKKSDVVAPGWGFGFGGAVLLHPEKAEYPAGTGTLSWSGAYGSHFFMDRESGVSFVALTNTTPTGMAGPFAVALARAMYSNNTGSNTGR